MFYKKFQRGNLMLTNNLSFSDLDENAELRSRYPTSYNARAIQLPFKTIAGVKG